jgi:hypothetical protein
MNHFKHMCRGGHVSNRVDVQDDEPEHPDSYAFTIHVNKLSLQRAVVQVGGLDIKFILDSGADCNVVDRLTWEKFKLNGGVVSRSEKGGPKVFSYTGKTTIKVLGKFGLKYKRWARHYTMPSL